MVIEDTSMFSFLFVMHDLKYHCTFNSVKQTKRNAVLSKLVRRDMRDEVIRRRHLANRAWFMYMYVVNRHQGKRILTADFKTLFDNLTVTVGNHVIRMIGFTEFRAGIRTKQAYKLITLCHYANVHLKVTSQYVVVFHTSPNKYCFVVFRLCSDFYGKLLHNVEKKHLAECLPGIIRRYIITFYCIIIEKVLVEILFIFLHVLSE